MPECALDAVAGLIGEFAKIHLPGVAREPEHEYVRAGAEYPLLAAGEDDRADLGVFEADPLQGIVQFDVDAKIIGIELQAIARTDARVFVDFHGERRHRTVDSQAPVPVARGMRIEAHRGCVRAYDRRCGFRHDVPEKVQYNALLPEMGTNVK
jgi:hypothetical protein